MSTTYKNGFFKPNLPGSQPTITTDAKPEEYRGYQIYQRDPYSFDIVKDGVRVENKGSLMKAYKWIDVKF